MQIEKTGSIGKTEKREQSTQLVYLYMSVSNVSQKNTKW